MIEDISLPKTHLRTTIFRTWTLILQGRVPRGCILSWPPVEGVLPLDQWVEIVMSTMVIAVIGSNLLLFLYRMSQYQDIYLYVCRGMITPCHRDEDTKDKVPPASATTHSRTSDSRLVVQ
jgi:hypothetical protein